jgi:esterase/lipase
MKWYIKTKKIKYVERFLKELFTEKDAFAVQYLSKVFLHFKMDFTQVPVIKTQAAKSIKTPITLIAAKNDLMFPGEKMITRANNIFPSLKRTLVLEQSKHVQNRSDNKRIVNLIHGSLE